MHALLCFFGFSSEAQKGRVWSLESGVELGTMGSPLWEYYFVYSQPDAPLVIDSLLPFQSKAFNQCSQNQSEICQWVFDQAIDENECIPSTMVIHRQSYTKIRYSLVKVKNLDLLNRIFLFDLLKKC